VGGWPIREAPSNVTARMAVMSRSGRMSTRAPPHTQTSQVGQTIRLTALPLPSTRGTSRGRPVRTNDLEGTISTTPKALSIKIWQLVQ
jgi:hypothetical protein